jgi:hypothetical protein
MAQLTVEPAASQATVRHGWFYVGKLVAAALAILLCLVTIKFFIEHKFTSASAGFEAALAQPRLDLLLIGSSHTRKSYDMQLLEEETGVQSLFLVSYDGVDMTSMSQMLDYMASRPGRCPRHVVVEAYGVLLGRRPDLQDPRFFVEAPPSMKLEILRSYIAGRPYFSAFLDAFDLLVNRGNDEMLAFPLYAWAQKMDSYKGGRAGFNFPGMTPEQFQQLRAKYYDPTPNPDQVAALNHIMDLAQSQHVGLIFVDTPMPAPVASNPVVASLRSDLKDMVTARGFPFIDGSQGFPNDDPTLFSDGNHLSSKGREEFTARIAGPLKLWAAGEPTAAPN